MRSLGLSLAVSAVALALVAATSEEWLSFKRQFGRVYQPEEEVFRRQVFNDNLEVIKQHNAEFDAGRSRFRLGVNQFADLTNEEFRQKVLSELKLPALSAVVGSTVNSSSGSSIPDSFDWRNEGVPITIRDQGALGDSWTISVISSIEAGVFISSGQMVSLSRQNLLDCLDWPSTIDALYYARDHGVASEADYPTTQSSGECRPVPPTAKVDDVHEVPEGDEEAQAEGLLQNPMPVLFDAGHISFQLYSSGIYSDPSCSARNLDHSLLLVGYGVSADTDFWTLANSWGSSWGEHGYVRVVRGVNMCGVASMAANPTAAHLV